MSHTSFIAATEPARADRDATHSSSALSIAPETRRSESARALSTRSTNSTCAGLSPRRPRVNQVFSVFSRTPPSLAASATEQPAANRSISAARTSTVNLLAATLHLAIEGGAGHDSAALRFAARF
jgi:hypothetical protein